MSCIQPSWFKESSKAVADVWEHNKKEKIRKNALNLVIDRLNEDMWLLSIIQSVWRSWQFSCSFRPESLNPLKSGENVRQNHPTMKNVPQGHTSKMTIFSLKTHNFPHVFSEHIICDLSKISLADIKGGIIWPPSSIKWI